MRGFYAETTVSGNASATVVFEDKKPIINSVGQSTSSIPNYLDFQESGVLFRSASFSWNVSGADRYELIGPRGAGPRGAIYSGTASSYVWPKGSTVPTPGRVNRNENWTLRAWNGSSFTDYSMVIRAEYASDTTDPSG